MDRSLAKNAFYNVIYKILNVIFPLITASYTARVLLPQGVGKVSYAQTIASYFVLIAALGIPTYGVKAIANLHNCSNKKKVNQTVTELLLILGCSTIVCCVVYLCVVFSLQSARSDFKLYLAAGLQIALVAFNVDWFYQGTEKYRYITTRSLIVKLCSLIAVVCFVKSPDDYIIYALITSLAVGGNHLLNIINLHKYASISFAGVNVKRHLKPVFILLLSTIAIEVYSKIDITMLGILSDDTHVGYYSNSIKIINVVLMGITAITSVFLPRLSQYYNDNKMEFTRLVNLGLQIIVGIALPCTIGLILTSKDLVSIMFGAAFSPTGGVLKILAPLLLIKGAGDLLCYQVIISAGKEKYFLLTNSTAAVVNVILNGYLIPIFYQNGAATASVISELIVNIGMLFVAVKIVRIKFDKKVYLPVIMSTVFMGITVWGVSQMNINSTLRLCTCLLTGIFIYVLSNVVLKNALFMNIIRNLKGGKEK